MTEQLKPCQHWNVTATRAKGPFCADCGTKLVSLFSGIERTRPAQPAQPAQAVPVLTDDEIESIAKPFIQPVGDHWCHEDAIRENAVEDFARAIEQAVRAKMGVAVPRNPRRITYTCPACAFSLERQE